MTIRRTLLAMFMIAELGGCSTSRAEPSATVPTPSSEPAASTRAPTVATRIPEASQPKAGAQPVAESPESEAAATSVYPWEPSSKDRLDLRFKTPLGFTRVDVHEGSFAAFLRTLPLLPADAKVVDFRGRPLHGDGHHPHISAVADLDVGSKDLQHCADVIIRLHGEWRYGRGDRAMSYRSVSGQRLSYASYLTGERAIVSGNRLEMRQAAGAHRDDHTFFRGWLDDVFAWAGTASLERDAQKVKSIAEARAGDFFVKSGSPFGHAVLILDVAKDDKGRVALLLGQSYMPAQSFQILKPAEASATVGESWFLVSPEDQSVETPFWPAFPMSALRRMGG